MNVQRFCHRLSRRFRTGLLAGLILSLAALTSCAETATPTAVAPAGPSPAPVAAPSPAPVPQVAATLDATLTPGPAQTIATRTFVNSPANLDGKLAEHYVDFSFAYPAHWTVDPEAGKPGASNFAKVTHDLEGGFTVENFAAGHFFGTGSAAADAKAFPGLVAQLSEQFAPAFPNYRKISHGKTRVGAYDGYELRFESSVPDTPKGTIQIWARAVMVPMPGSTKGVTLIMMATNLSPDVKGMQDVGVKGELPVILDSLKLGK